MKRVLITGSSGLIGSEAVAAFDARGWSVVGVDNNMRADFFGPRGDTTWNLNRLLATTRNFRSVSLDIRDRPGVAKIVADVKPDLVIHAAAQPSHDLAAKRPFDDFDVNAVGTLNLLEAVRAARDAALCDPVFIFMSTNKVYGDAPNELPLVELPTRWDYARPENFHGIDEQTRIDRSMHSIFGISKTAADIMTQEYGRYFGVKTGTFRGGCLTGKNHSGVELHGFLSYLFKAVSAASPYTIFGYKAKQVRDNIHSADVISAFLAFHENPRPGEVYNLGGCRQNSCSMTEAIAAAEGIIGRKFSWSYNDENRKGDHICYITDMSKFKSHYPDWRITRSLEQIYQELAQPVEG
ncbi:MAG TPA: NAD-dependent epimerase/dehydratase family protein [Tepidisphaeraceae bacterium]|jgi:CDP-paratose 2-epimerase|nr:NAD-dependent epimerase/dehydratase family protein [Tepidisphaeraceae bacterium]